jgi:hypothetical protein
MAKKAKRHPKEKMKAIKRGKEWFITNLPNEGWWVPGEPPEYGPYDTRADVLDALEGLRRFIEDNPESMDD